MRRRIVVLVLALLSALAASEAAAQAGPRSWGVRGGFRIGEGDFDQVVLGAHVDMGDVATNLRFEPNVLLGIGSNVTVVSVDPEIHYVFRDDPIGDETYFYTGGGIGLHIRDLNRAVDVPGVDDPDTQLKINLVAGVETAMSKRTGLFGELRLSFIDGTWFDFLGGINLLR